jgi:glyoxylase-like metal-dependent hydrolase (beta-lactamase superfamily II)
MFPLLAASEAIATILPRRRHCAQGTSTARRSHRVDTVIHRAGTRLVNWYLLEEAGRVTIVDAGLSGYRPQLEGALRAIGRGLDDVEAIVLTHAHIDHTGFAQKLQDERGTPVFAHEAERPQATTGKPPKTEASVLIAMLRHRRAREVIVHIARNGGARPPKIADVTTFTDGDRLDVPGHPVAVHTPGHSPGHCVLHVAEEGAAFTGDALSGWSTVTGAPGPILPPAAFSNSMAQARQSLERVEALDAGTLYFGHGDPWTGGAAAAVQRARELDAAGR